MSGNWSVRLGSLWRTFKVQGVRTAPFVKTGMLESTDGRLQLTAKYDPPGSGWLGAAAALVTGIIVVIAAQQFGFCAGPGWLFWFIGIAMLRRRDVTLDLQAAEVALVDSAQRRLAFRVDYEGKPRWVAVDVPENFEEVAQVVSTQMQGRVFADKIDRTLTSGSIAMIVLASLLVGLILLSVVGALIYTMRRPPARRLDSLLIPRSSWSLALIVPGFFRRIRCTSE